MMGNSQVGIISYFCDINKVKNEWWCGYLLVTLLIGIYLWIWLIYETNCLGYFRLVKGCTKRKTVDNVFKFNSVNVLKGE